MMEYCGGEGLKGEGVQNHVGPNPLVLKKIFGNV